jgi:hypothetical protein
MIAETAEDSGWTASELRIAIGRALLASHVTMTAADLAAVVSVHQSNIKKEAERMALAGLIERGARRQTSPSQRGPKPEAFGMSPAQRQRASRDLTAYVPPGVLRQGQEVVRASAGPGHAIDLLGALTDAEATVKASWVALIGDDLFVAYSGPSAAKPAVELQAVLEAANVPSRRATVARVAPAHEWVRDGREVARAVDRTQASRRKPPVV